MVAISISKYRLTADKVELKPHILLRSKQIHEGAPLIKLILFTINNLTQQCIIYWTEIVIVPQII